MPLDAGEAKPGPSEQLLELIKTPFPTAGCDPAFLPRDGAGMGCATRTPSLCRGNAQVHETSCMAA